MKATKFFTLLAGSSLLVSGSAFAGNAGKKTLHLDKTVTVEGKTLPAGDYKVALSGTGADVKLDIIKGKETVASVSARMVAVPTPNRLDGYSSTAGKDGSYSVNTLFFSGDKFDLELGDAASTKAAPTTATSGTN
jgi:hypothetical protein